MKDEFTKMKHNIVDQIVQGVHTQVKKIRKRSNNKHNKTNNINLNNDEKFDNKLAKIHGQKANKKYKQLLRSHDPILNNNELVNALSDPDEKIGRNYKTLEDLGNHIKMLNSELIGLYLHQVLNKSLRAYFKQFDMEKQILLFNNIMKDEFTKMKHNMVDQIVQRVHTQVEKIKKRSNNKHNKTNNINLDIGEKFDNNMAKIHGQKSNKKYKKLLRSYDPILNDSELVKALSDPDDKIGRNYKTPDDFGLHLEVLNKSLRAYFKQFDKEKQILLFNNIIKDEFTKMKHMVDQIVQGVHTQVEKSQKRSNNKHNKTNNINLDIGEKIDSKLAKIHGQKSNKKYKKLLRSYDPILNDSELVKALSDPDDKIGRNYKTPDDFGTKMSGKTNNPGINDKSEASSSSPPNVMEASIKRATNSCEETSLKMPNLTKNDKCNNISIIEILPDDNYDNKQPAISAVSNEISRNVLIQASSSEVKFTTSLKVTIQQYRHENNIDFLKLKKIVFKHDPSSSKTFKKLVYAIKNSFNFELPRVTNIISWHSAEMGVIQKLLKEILQTINQTKNKIIHFMTFLNVLFRKSVNTHKLSTVEIYHSFFRFTDFINRCLLFQNNSILIKWLPMVWNNCFYYSLILVDFILYNYFKRKINYKSFHTLLEWSYVPDIQKLFQILSYDNKSRSARIIYNMSNNNYMKPSNILKSEHQDEPSKKKIKLT